MDGVVTGYEYADLSDFIEFLSFHSSLFKDVQQEKAVDQVKQVGHGCNDEVETEASGLVNIADNRSSTEVRSYCALGNSLCVDV